MICSRCGTENPDEVSFCTECGEALAKPVNAQMKIDPAKKKRIIRLAFAAVGVLALFLILVVVLKPNGAESAALDFCDALREMDLNAGKELLPPAVLEHIAASLDLDNAEYEIIRREELTEELITELNGRYNRFGVENYISSGYVIYLRAKVSGKPVSRDEIQLYMVEVDGDWYLEPLMTLEELDEAEVYEDAFIINWD